MLPVSTLEQALDMAVRHTPHALLLSESFIPPGGVLSCPIPWFALLSAREEDKVDRALRAGAYGCLLKPLRIEEVQFLLKRMSAEPVQE